MGTSSSSSGPGGRVPLVPPWVSDPGVAAPSATPVEQGVAQGAANGGVVLPAHPTHVAPAGRFRGARTDLGQFATSGSARSLRSGLREYVRRGLGGSGRASHRLAGTARKAGALYGVLHALSTGTAPPADLGIQPAGLAGRPAREAVDRIAEALSPSDGTQDAEASRQSISLALRELLTREPTVDLTALTEPQIELVVELYIGQDICRRIELDVGKTILDRAPDASTAMRRLDQMYRYVQQSVAAAFRQRRQQSQALGRQVAVRLASRVIRDTFEVFESYVQ